MSANWKTQQWPLDGRRSVFIPQSQRRAMQNNVQTIIQLHSFYMLVRQCSKSLKLYSLWNCWGQNTGVSSLYVFQGIFPTQGLNPGLPHCWQILYQMSHKGSPRILEWVAYPFSREPSWPRNQTRVSCIAGRFFTNWAIREAQQDNAQNPSS